LGQGAALHVVPAERGLVGVDDTAGVVVTEATKIGRIGQTSLEKWAAQAGMTANPSFHDDRGWDALVQVNSDEQDGSGPLDRAPPQTSCMIQIKTTCAQEQSEPILLSNWQRMCSDPIPWFVLAIHLGEDLEPQKAYLVHIDEAWCERVLRRLRELDPSERFRLNKHTISVTWSEEDRLRELHGRELLRLVRDYVRPNQRDYVECKMRRSLLRSGGRATVNLPVLPGARGLSFSTTRVREAPFGFYLCHVPRRAARDAHSCWARRYVPF
jgi:hypothetical protein